MTRARSSLENPPNVKRSPTPPEPSIRSSDSWVGGIMRSSQKRRWSPTASLAIPKSMYRSKWAMTLIRHRRFLEKRYASSRKLRSPTSGTKSIKRSLRCRHISTMPNDRLPKMPVRSLAWKSPESSMNRLRRRWPMDWTRTITNKKSWSSTSVVVPSMSQFSNSTTMMAPWSSK